MARRKHVPHNELAHRWANDPSGSDWAEGYSMFFRDGAIYSWGPHFPIARHVKGRQGNAVVLFTSESCSSSTAKHKTIAWRACHHLNTFMVPDVSDSSESHKMNMRYYQGEYDKEIERLERLNCNSYEKPGEMFNRAAFLYQEAQRYAQAFGLDDCLVPAFKVHLDWLRKRYKRLKDDAEVNARKRHEAIFRRWLAGADVKLPYGVQPSDAEIHARVLVLRETHSTSLAEFLAGSRDDLIFDLRDNLTDEERNIRRAFEEKRDKEVLDEWRAGGLRRPPHRALGEAHLRLSRDGKTIETSMGASFPVEDAKRAFPLISRVRKAGQAWHRTGPEAFAVLGYYRIDHVTASGTVRAGCHVVAWPEIERVAKQLDLI